MPRGVTCALPWVHLWSFARLGVEAEATDAFAVGEMTEAVMRRLQVLRKSCRNDDMPEDAIDIVSATYALGPMIEDPWQFVWSAIEDERLPAWFNGRADLDFASGVYVNNFEALHKLIGRGSRSHLGMAPLSQADTATLISAERHLVSYLQRRELLSRSTTFREVCVLRREFITPKEIWIRSRMACSPTRRVGRHLAGHIGNSRFNLRNRSQIEQLLRDRLFPIAVETNQDDSGQ